ncbi:nuclear transport factor 2 family protein [Sphingorhabdus lacus]|uniref:Nuclear transport factor 2 family protein n=1 Tax=Sphingorhabdus lacus TaxID=392610 RepID=A0A6I6L3R3_9SPHN|nr:nuclear transport factor 2 family protein [Sphingorhabdus lacus]QGY80630.1 nuclear transport factor 2 family protein [Sphingorhabdus lacus]
MTEIEEIEARRRAAMVACDLTALDELIDDEALYVHTNGLLETKAEYLARVRDRTYRYQAVTQPEMAVRMLSENVAVVTGRIILQVVVPGGNIQSAEGRSIVLWARRDGGWKMQHYQGTRL